MNDVDCKTGAACGVGPWFTRLAAHNTPYVVHWVLAGSASSRPQLYTASVRIYYYVTTYTFEWCQSGRRKYKQKGKLGQIHTHTPRRSSVACVNPQGTECYIHTQRENIGSTAHNDAFDFVFLKLKRWKEYRQRSYRVESLAYQVSLLRERKQQQKKAGANKFITVIVRAPSASRPT